jgi:enoyl-CoA hydratase
MTDATDKILAVTEDGVGWLTFNNPARRNAMSLEMWQATEAALDAFENDPGVRVIVMRGAGGKAFVSGADISQFEDQRKNAEQSEAYNRISGSARQRMATLTKPMIAMIQGFCIGGGVAVAAAADLRVASEDSQFGIPAARLGLGYGFDSISKIVGLVGPAYAKELLFTARRLDAQEAHRIGLVNRVVPADQLEATVRAIALEIAANAPLTIRAAKLGIDQAMLDPDERDMVRVAASVRACFESEDYATGRRAFMEKRTPEFKGR